MRPDATSSSSTSSGPNSDDAPRNVFIVRSASGVTTMRQRPVGGPSTAGGDRNTTPLARMSWAKTTPSWSSKTLPRYPARPPKLATPATVFAAEPPDTSMPGPIAA